MRKLFIGLIKMYQIFISPMLGPSCRYYPTCSEYAFEAIEMHGVIKGSFLAIKRVLRCHPGCEGGIDHVPENTCQHQKADKTSN